MSNYIHQLKEEGYVPLRTRHYNELQNSYPALNRKQPLNHQDLFQVDIIDQQTDQGDSEQPGNQAELAAKDLPPVIVTKPMEESSTEPQPIIIDIGTINDAYEHDSDDDRTKDLQNVNTASA